MDSFRWKDSRSNVPFTNRISRLHLSLSSRTEFPEYTARKPTNSFPHSLATRDAYHRQRIRFTRALSPSSRPRNCTNLSANEALRGDTSPVSTGNPRESVIGIGARSPDSRPETGYENRETRSGEESWFDRGARSWRASGAINRTERR